jgi:chaperone BCS1
MLASLFEWLDVVTGGNQFATAGIVTTLTVSATYMLKTLPVKLFELIKKQLMTSLTVNNTTYMDRIMFLQLNELMHSGTAAGFTRTFSVLSRWDDNGKLKISLGIGYGNHLTVYRGRLLLVRKETLDSSGGDLLKEQITVIKLGRSRSLFDSLVEDLRNHDHSDEIAVYDFKEEWRLQSHIRKNTLDDIALNPETYQFFKSEMDAFVNGADTFNRLGLSHKLTIALHGEPGTGKTSMIRALAGTYNMSVCILNLSNMSDATLLKSMLTAPKNAFIVLEDVDAATSTHDRKSLTADKDGTHFLTLSGILNALDGIQTLSGNVVFMTTNYLERLDSALLRPGRVDHIVELPYINAVTVQRYFERLYPEMDVEQVVFVDMPAKDIHDVVFRAKACHITAKNLLMKYHNQQLKQAA